MELGKILLNEQFLIKATHVAEITKERLYITTFKAEICAKPRCHNLLKFFTIVSDKAKSGVDVRFITNQTTPRRSIPLSNFNAIQELRRTNAKVRCLKNNRICHAKLILSDSFTAIIGSHNLSVKSCQSNFEISYIFNDAYIVKELYSIFDTLWDNAKEP